MRVRTAADRAASAVGQEPPRRRRARRRRAARLVCRRGPARAGLRPVHGGGLGRLPAQRRAGRRGRPGAPRQVPPPRRRRVRAGAAGVRGGGRARAGLGHGGGAVVQRGDGGAAGRVRGHADRLLPAAQADPRGRSGRGDGGVRDARDVRGARAGHPALALVPDHGRVRGAVHGRRQALLGGAAGRRGRGGDQGAAAGVHRQLSALRMAAGRRCRRTGVLPVGAGVGRRRGLAVAAAVDGSAAAGGAAVRRLRRPGRGRFPRGCAAARPSAARHRGGVGGAVCACRGQSGEVVGSARRGWAGAPGPAGARGRGRACGSGGPYG